MTNVALIDIRHTDGEPWEIAAVAGQQVADCLALLDEALDGFSWAVRGSWLSQEHHRTGEMPSADEFTASVFGRKLVELQEMASAASKTARLVTKAAAHDPRSY